MYRNNISKWIWIQDFSIFAMSARLCSFATVWASLLAPTFTNNFAIRWIEDLQCDVKSKTSRPSQVTKLGG